MREVLRAAADLTLRPARPEPEHARRSMLVLTPHRGAEVLRRTGGAPAARDSVPGPWPERSDTPVSRSPRSVSGWRRSDGRATSTSVTRATWTGTPTSNRWNAPPTRSSTPPTSAAFAISTRPAPTAWPRRSSAAGSSKRGFGPDDVTVGSKWGYTYTADWHVHAKVHEVKDLSAATLRRQLDESQELLGNHLRLYQIHSATIESGVLDDPEVLFELGKLRASGMAIGFTATGPQPGGDDRAGPRGRRL